MRPVEYLVPEMRVSTDVLDTVRSSRVYAVSKRPLFPDDGSIDLHALAAKVAMCAIVLFPILAATEGVISIVMVIVANPLLYLYNSILYCSEKSPSELSSELASKLGAAFAFVCEAYARARAPAPIPDIAPHPPSPESSESEADSDDDSVGAASEPDAVASDEEEEKEVSDDDSDNSDAGLSHDVQAAAQRTVVEIEEKASDDETHRSDDEDLFSGMSTPPPLVIALDDLE